MSQIEKLRKKMENNPQGDWRIEDVDRLAKAYGFSWDEGKGSHKNFYHEKLREIFTIPSKRPIKAFYIKRLLELIAEVED
ncbi:MAG: type II toxin-antitoxin system HicA family toxin [Pseudomonadota bacterium]